MKRLFLILVICIFSISCSTPSKPASGRGVSEAGQEKFVPQRPKSFYTANGIHTYVVEDREVPLVHGTLYIPGGSLWAKDDEVGMTSAMGTLLRTGGAGSRSARELDRELEKLAASISSSFGTEYGSISFSCLRSDLETVFALFADVILRPRFQQDRIELTRLSALDRIKRRKDSPGEVGSIAFRQLLFGSSPYGRAVRSEDVKRITRDSLRAIYHRMMSPEGAVLAVSGDISEEELKILTKKYLENWKPLEKKSPQPPAVPERGQPGIFFIRLPFQQATVFMGEVGIPRFTPDWYSILVFNEMFGEGNFASKLMKVVRSDEGLAYSINGSIVPSGGRGVNSIAFQTKAESTGAAILASLGVLRSFQEGRIEDAEVHETKNALLNSFIFKFDTSSDIVQRKAGQEILDFPDDYDAVYMDRMNAVNRESVREVAASRWHPDAFTIVVAGDDAAAESIRSLPGGPLSGYKFNEVLFDETLVLP